MNHLRENGIVHRDIKPGNIMRLLGEEVPRRILPSVPSWKEAEVQTWLQQIGFSQYCENFRVEPHGVAGWQSEQAHPRGPRGL